MVMLDGSVVGIRVFLRGGEDKHAALGGRIKQRPEEFVVRELAVDGQAVDLSPTPALAQRIPTLSEREAVVQEAVAAREGAKPKRERLTFETPADGWPAALASLLPEPTRQRLADVAAETLEETHVEVPQDFTARVHLQVCIQHCFPGLDCKLLRAPDASSSRIHVSLDGLYKKLRRAGVAVENSKRVLGLVRRGASDPHAARGVPLEHEDTKEARTALHRQLATTSALVKSRTETRDGVQQIVAFLSPGSSNKKRKRGEHEVYVRFVLQKVNLEHFTCFERMARRLRIPASAFAYAGTKDKVAITYQHVTVKGIEPKRLLTDLNKDPVSVSGFQIGHLQYVAAPLTLGKSTGNRFTVVVRDLAVEPTDADVRARIDDLSEHGFVNFFGFQRVGLPTSSVRPHHIGALIIGEQWEDAARQILTATEHDTPDVAAAKHAFTNDDDVEKALGLLPSTGLQAERAVLMGLKRFGKDAFKAALLNVPFARRAMYLHAYQSYVFNCMASERIRQLGAHVVEGDLVYTGGDDDDTTIGVATAQQAAELNAMGGEALRHVVLPLPGSNVLYPGNTVGQGYAELLEADGTRTPLSESRELKGTYRRLVEIPRDVSWAWRDLEGGGTGRGLEVAFSLASGSFATMCLRELLHTDL